MAILGARAVSLFSGPKTKKERSDIVVVADGETVVAGDDVVSLGIYYGSRLLGNKVVYVSALEGDIVPKYSFSEYKDETFYDWSSLSGAGLDSPAYMVAGYTPGPEMQSNRDFQRRKDLTYVNFHFRRTEDSEIGGVGGPDSSCIVKTGWDWESQDLTGISTIPDMRNRWSRPFQAYRYQRKNVDQYIWGRNQQVITSRNKVRGSGKVFSFRLESEPGKDCQILGWSLILGVNGNA